MRLAFRRPCLPACLPSCLPAAPRAARRPVPCVHLLARFFLRPWFQQVKRVNLQHDLSLGASLADHQLESLMSRTPALEELQLRYCSALTSPGLARILRRKYCPNLRVLQLGARSTKKSMDRRCSHRFTTEVSRAIAER